MNLALVGEEWLAAHCGRFAQRHLCFWIWVLTKCIARDIRRFKGWGKATAPHWRPPPRLRPMLWVLLIFSGGGRRRGFSPLLPVWCKVWRFRHWRRRAWGFPSGCLLLRLYAKFTVSFSKTGRLRSLTCLGFEQRTRADLGLFYVGGLETW
jgi:hypothetical protein